MEAKRPKQYDDRILVRLPSAYRDLVISQARQIMTTPSDWIRAAIIFRLEKD
jgi:hypothetical protein